MSKKEFITLLAITLIVALVWVGSDWVHTKSSANNLPDVQKDLAPIDPSFDKQTLDQISSLATPGPIPSGGPTSSPKPSISPSPSASSSARISPLPSPPPLATSKPSPSPSPR